MTRQNFFQGQCVAPEHLNALQDYADSGQANLISGLLGYGVVEGFEVSVVDGYVVEVTSGLAFNLAGERLILDDSKQVDLSQYVPSSSVIKLGVVVDYEKSESIVNGYGDTVHTKWTPTVQFIMGETLDSGVFELAEITINSTSIASITNTSENFMTLQKLVQNTAMEIGTNDNGTYIKFENGVLICLSNTLSLSYMSNTTRTAVWTYPYVFKTTPNGSCSGTTGVNFYDASLSVQTTYTTQLIIISLGVSSSNYWTVAKAIAIGFWK